MLTIIPDSANGIASSVIDLDSTGISHINRAISRTFPPAISVGQLYYWSYKWQQGEQIARDELARGLGKTFDNAQDAIRWLLSDD